MVVYWTSEDYEPNIPVETVLIEIILGYSGTVTYTIMVYYLYRKESIFSVSNNSYGWSIIFKIHFNLPKILWDETSVRPKGKDWLLTNLFLLLGFCCMLSAVSSDFALNMYYGFHCIHNFLQNISWLKKFQYYFAVSTNFLWIWGNCVLLLYFLCNKKRHDTSSTVNFDNLILLHFNSTTPRPKFAKEWRKSIH